MSLIKEGSKLYSIFFNKCPRCNQANFWASNNPFKNIFLKNSEDLNSCSNCFLKYELEIGFWYGAMYISYALGVAVMLFFWGSLVFFLPLLNINLQVIIIVFGIILLAPVNYHLSRLIWINFFIDYKKEK